MTATVHPPESPPGRSTPGPLDAGALTRCRRRVHLDHDPSAVTLPRALPDPSLETRRADAVTHREELGRQLGGALGEGWRVVGGGTTAERVAATAAAVAAQAPFVWGAVLPVDADRRGGSALLVRLPGGGYVPVIVVRHRVTDPGVGAVTSPLTALAPGRAQPDDTRRNRSQPRDLLRLAHLHRLLRSAGWAPADGTRHADAGGVIGLDADVVVWHDLRSGHWPGGRSTLTEYDLRLADRTAVALAAATGAPALAEPSRVTECRRCPWWPVCEAELTRADDVSLVVRGETAVALREVGVRTVTGLAALDAAAEPPIPFPAQPFGDVVALARAWRRGLPVVRRVPRVPVLRADVEVDIDMESFGESGAYLWGVLLAHPGGAWPGDEPDGYRAFATWEPVPTDDEARSFAEFWAWLTRVRARAADTGRTFAAYCYNEQAENRWLLGSAERFAGYPGIPPQAEVQAFIADESWVDLFAVVNDWFLCAQGKGLKRIAPAAGFAWRDAEAGGENSMRWYRDAVGMDGGAPDPEQRRRLLEYNADDVAATRAVREWMTSPAIERVPLAGELGPHPMAPTKYEQLGPAGAASSTHYLATSTAMAELARGGNAFDAAVAAGFVLQVVEPHLCGPGGEVPAVFVTAADPTPRVLCGQGVAPAAATVERIRDGFGLPIVPGTGLLAATVPGAWDGWLTLLRDHGTRTLEHVLAPALGYAAGGFPLVPRIPTTIATVARHFRAHWPTSAATWLPGNAVPTGRHRLPALAATWRRLLASGAGDRDARIEAARDAWYRGFVAEEIAAFCATPVRDESGRDHPGLLVADDLARWSAGYEDALTVDVGGGWSLAKPGAWSQGPVLAQMLQLLRGAVSDVSDVSDVSYVDGVATADTVHRAVEAAKLAFADREAWYGDSAPVPLHALVSRDYAAGRRLLIGPEASLELRPGSPDGREPRMSAHAARPGGQRGDGVSAPGLGEPTVSRTGAVRGDTVHIDVVDAAGNMISATPSGGWLQSSPTIGSLGFCLGTRAQMFWLEHGLPSSLVPGRRPRTTLSPSLGLRDGEPRIAFGTPGGDQQDQWQLCFWLAHTVGGLDLQAAIDAPAWHSTAFPASFAPRGWEPGGLVAESRLGAATLDDLRRRGHRVVDAGGWALGRLCAVGRGVDGLLRAAADTRSGVGAAAAL